MAGRIAPFFGGIVFALGLGLSGMTRPEKIVGFLDFFGAWDPTMIFVMVGAIATYSLVYHWSRGRPAPFFSEKFHLPSRKEIDGRLLAGAAIFGVGWALAGYCPGPGLASLVSGQAQPLLFVFSMLVGMALYKVYESL